MKKRKTSSRTKRFPRKPAAGQRLKELWQTPEFRERMRQRNRDLAERMKTDPEFRLRCTRVGVPDGYRRRHMERLRPEARAAAERFIKRMEDEGQLPQVTVPGSDEEMAKEVLKEAYMLAVLPGDQRERLAAMRTVLEYTKSKPASTQKIDLTSDQWLEAAVKEMKDNGD
jgi:hypothetical protein